MARMTKPNAKKKKKNYKDQNQSITYMAQSLTKHKMLSIKI